MGPLSQRSLTQTIQARNRLDYTHVCRKLRISCHGSGRKSAKDIWHAFLLAPIWALLKVFPFFCTSKFMRHCESVVMNRDKVTLVAFDKTEFPTIAVRRGGKAYAYIYWYFKIGEVELVSNGGCKGEPPIERWKRG